MTIYVREHYMTQLGKLAITDNASKHFKEQCMKKSFLHRQLVM